MGKDAIELALNSPIDWSQFENVAYEVLVNDDLPRLRKLGGIADKGVDAVQEAFFQNDEQRTDIVVQVTSQKAQQLKLNDTIKKLKANHINCSQLILLFRHPVASTVRSKLLQDGVKNGVAVDVRDQPYLIAQLGKDGSTVFARYFQDLRTQVQKLLALKDPLALAGNQLRHAMLASLGAYVLNPRARLVRNTLFEKTVLAALVAAGHEINQDDLIKSVHELVPEEMIDSQRVRVATEQLKKDGYCSEKAGMFAPTETALAEVGAVLARTSNAYQELFSAILQACKSRRRLDDATIGYLENNVRKALLMLLRIWGPLEETTHAAALAGPVSNEILQILSANIGEGLGRTALAEIGAYVRDPNNSSGLSVFVRTYAALALRNLDPIGRRWQQAVLSRTMIALDTDAVLNLIVQELPEHQPVLNALHALAREGVKIVVSESVLQEAV